MACSKCGKDVVEFAKQNLCENCASSSDSDEMNQNETKRKRSLKRPSPSLNSSDENEGKEMEYASEVDGKSKRPRRSTRVSALKAKSLITGDGSTKTKNFEIKEDELSKDNEKYGVIFDDNSDKSDNNSNATESKPLSKTESNTTDTIPNYQISPSELELSPMNNSTQSSSDISTSVPAQIASSPENIPRPAAVSQPSTSQTTTASTSSTAPGTSSTLPSHPTVTSTVNPAPSNTTTRVPQVRFAFGFSLAPPSQTGPADIQWIFNDSGTTDSMNLNVDDIVRMMQEGSGSTNGGDSEVFIINGIPVSTSTRILPGGFPLPVPRPARAASTSSTRSTGTRTTSNSNPNTDTSSNNTNPFTTNPLDLARQMFEIISMSRTADSPNSLASMLGQMTQLMFPGLSTSGSDPTSRTSQIENMLNELFTRAFAAAEAAAAPPGLSDESISKLPIISESDIKTDESVDCAICRDHVTPSPEDKCVKLPCNHMFHFDCIEPWLKRVPSCPICRRSLQ